MSDNPNPALDKPAGRGVDDALNHVSLVLDELGVDRYLDYTDAVEELSAQQGRERYELELHHCHQRLDLLHQFGASVTAQRFWTRQMTSLTRRFQLGLRLRRQSARKTTAPSL